LKDGEWTEWHCTGGSKKSQGEYKYGKKEGVWKEWEGKLKSQTEWHDDKLHGKIISWYPDGHIESESEFRDGKYYGVRKYYSRDGKTEYIEYMDSGGNIIKTEKSNKSVQ
jgi:antitoxin component YwqK of YwqJK toxin-antitoxin module